MVYIHNGRYGGWVTAEKWAEIKLFESTPHIPFAGDGPALETRSGHGGDWCEMRYHEDDGPQFHTDHDTWANDPINDEDDYRFAAPARAVEPTVGQAEARIQKALKEDRMYAKTWHAMLVSAITNAQLYSPNDLADRILKRCFCFTAPPRVKVGMATQDLIDSLAPDYEVCTREDAIYRTDPERMCGLYKSGDGGGWLLGTDLAGDVAGTEYIFLRKKAR